MIKAIIVDDEKNSSEALQILLSENCSQVDIMAVCHSGSDALEQIGKKKPDLIFLDIEMPHMNGFEMLQRLNQIDFDLIFTTSYNQYAIKAFKFSALDYLLKPVDRQELINAVEKVVRKRSGSVTQQIGLLLQKMSQPSVPVQRIALPTMQGLELVPVSSIISCAASNNYTEFSLAGGKRILVSRTLKETEEMLEDYAFLRVHNSFIVNLNEISRYIRGEGGYIVMSDGSHIDVSRSRKELLMQKLQVMK